MLVLAVERHQSGTQLLQVGDRRRAAAHVRARAPVRPHAPREHDLLGAVREAVGAGQRRRQREHALDVPLLGAGADDPAPRAAAQQQVERVREQRLAGPGLAREHVEARGEPQLGALHQQQVLDAQFVQH